MRTFRADASLAYHNIKRGLDAIAPHTDRIAEELPNIDVAELQRLDDLALAVIYAAAQIDRSSDGSTPALLGFRVTPSSPRRKEVEQSSRSRNAGRWLDERRGEVVRGRSSDMNASPWRGWITSITRAATTRGIPSSCRDETRLRGAAVALVMLVIR
ncbi:hypothetical protein [Polyangium fumosum]|uniref:Uncharacterized protein n=1 Tax=Polyangium fumosum TaxID=889272 RepID=A0A4U1JI18_9BACT|nr:hypothetical protein [Polyangium fumosum]TKD12281.1 hypothetical protein E8A74_04015 [Polyangium fumosum]